MSIVKNGIDTTKPLFSIFPEEWRNKLKKCVNVSFDNLDHFKYVVSKLQQKNDMKCGMSYQQALDMLIKSQSDFPKKEQESIRNLVRSKLLKRGLITEEVYEEYRYSTDGTKVDVDVGKYAAGEADCVITPVRQYVDFFYELYVNISYPHGVGNDEVRNNVAKLLATIEELERKHIFIKITAVFPATSIDKDDNTFFSSIPVFSHKAFKSVDIMSSVINDRLLRKFYFAILEDVFGDTLKSNYGTATTLPKTMNIGEQFDEIKLFTEIMNSVGA